MSVTIFGSCRINTIANNNNLNLEITFTNSAKEVLQLIKFLKGYCEIPPPLDILCFRTALQYNNPIRYEKRFKEVFEKSKLCIVEISSNKNYNYNGFYLHHLAVDKRFLFHNIVQRTPKEIIDNCKIINSTYDELKNDIIDIKDSIYPQKLLIVSHYNSKQNNGKYLSSRNILINNLTQITSELNIPFINPTNVLSSFAQEDVMTNDLGHYTTLGKTTIINYINNYIKDMAL